MNKIFIVSLLLFISIKQSNAQITAPIRTTIKKDTLKSTTNTQTKTALPAPAPQLSTNNSIYKLTAARVTIKTGNDNKEFPSEVHFGLYVNGVDYAMEQPSANMRNEMKVNSITEFGLQNNSVYKQEAKLLTNFQQKGFAVTIRYKPNFFTDAWRIEGVTLTLQFKDQNGNPHPQFGNYTIVFNNASGLLTGTDWTMICRADGSFVPLTSSIHQ